MMSASSGRLRELDMVFNCELGPDGKWTKESVESIGHSIGIRLRQIQIAAEEKVAAAGNVSAHYGASAGGRSVAVAASNAHAGGTTTHTVASGTKTVALVSGPGGADGLSSSTPAAASPPASPAISRVASPAGNVDKLKLMTSFAKSPDRDQKVTYVLHNDLGACIGPRKSVVGTVILDKATTVVSTSIMAKRWKRRALGKR